MTEFITLDLPASYKMLGVLRSCIAEILANVSTLVDRETVTYNVQLSAQEIAVNIIEHAYGGESNEKRLTVTISLSEELSKIVIDMHDTGCTFDPTSITAPSLNEPQEGGYGLFLAQQLMDNIQYTGAPDHNVWKLEKIYAIKAGV